MVEVGIHTYLTPVGTVSHLLTQPEEALGSPEVWECVRPQDRGNLLFIGCQPGGMVPAPFSTGSQCQRQAALTQSRPPVHTREVETCQHLPYTLPPVVLGSLNSGSQKLPKAQTKAKEGSDSLCTVGTRGAAGNRGVCSWVPGLSLPHPRLPCTRTLVSAEHWGHPWSCRPGSCCPSSALSLFQVPEPESPLTGNSQPWPLFYRPSHPCLITEPTSPFHRPFPGCSLSCCPQP